jgi:phage shock protein PspC (stress-responsive transcriptional regulator)
MINLQWGFNPIIIRMLFAVTLFQHAGAPIPVYMTNTFKFPEIWNRFQKYVTNIINF